MAKRVQIKNEIRAQIHSGYLNPQLTSVLTFEKSELNKLEFFDGGKEFRYNGNMYDVAKTTETETMITYYCINDSKEMQLFANLDKHIKNHVSADKSSKDNGSKKTSDNVVKVYFSTLESYNFLQTGTSICFLPVNAMCLSAQKQNCTPPPPEFC